jgi:hypothetical protein
MKKGYIETSLRRIIWLELRLTSIQKCIKPLNHFLNDYFKAYSMSYFMTCKICGSQIIYFANAKILKEHILSLF